MTAAEQAAALVADGLDPREARWLVEEFGEDPAALAAAAGRRRHGEPLQYVMGHWPFRTLDLDVDPRVLIPRPETEELVDVALAELAARDVVAPLLVDLGCGSGAIGLAVVAELAERGVSATLIALDSSTDALDVARANARKHGLGAVSFVCSSWFDDLDPSLAGRIDLLVANPPYIGADEIEGLDPVLRHEPRGALVAADEAGVPGFGDVARIIQQSPRWLAPRGTLVLEHGFAQRDAALRAATAAGFAHALDLDDMAGHPRILVARMP